MKKLLKVSILAALFMAIFTITSSAANVTHSDLNSDGSMDYTVIFENEISDNAAADFRAAGWTVNQSTKTLTRNFPGVNETPKFSTLVIQPNTDSDELETVFIATPYKMEVGSSITLSDALTITGNNAQENISTEGKKITALKATGSTPARLQITEGRKTLPSGAEYIPEYYLDITVLGDSPAPSPAGATDFSNAKFTFASEGFGRVDAIVSGVTLQEGHYYSVYVSKDSTGTQQDTSKTTTLYNVDGENVITFTGENAHILSENTGDRYIHIIDKYVENTDTKYNISSIKVTDENITSRPLGARFDVYLYSADKSYIHNNIYASSDRKVTYKVGIVKSNDILRAFKNDPSSGFAKLLAYAKEDSSKLKEDTFELTDASMDTLDYNIVHDLNPTTGTYYYIYYNIDTVDGKYVPVEDVQIYQGSIDGTVVHFAYGSMNIPDSDESSESNQEELLPDRIVDTGEKVLVFALIGITAVVSVVLFKKNKGLKIK